MGILVRKEKDLEEIANNLMEAAAVMGLEINQDESKLLGVGTQKTE